MDLFSFKLGTASEKEFGPVEEGNFECSHRLIRVVKSREIDLKIFD
jgi:hypothetical protein